MDSIKVIDGNIEEESLGLSTADRNWIVENVNFVFHCAATIKFNEALELATKINIQGTNNLLKLAAKMKNLKVQVRSLHNCSVGERIVLNIYNKL